MSYTGTKSQSGNGTTININTGSVSTPTWTPIGEVVELSESGKMNKSDDATNLQSSAEEFVPTILSPGTYALTINRVSTDTGQLAMVASFTALPPTLVQYQVVLPKTPAQTTSGDKYVFLAMVEEMNDIGSLKADKVIKITAKLKVSGPQTFTAGS